MRSSSSAESLDSSTQVICGAMKVKVVKVNIVTVKVFTVLGIKKA